MSEKNKYQYVLPVGYVLKGGASDYVIEEVLGKGGFGITYKVKSRILYKNIHVDVHFAVKEFFPDTCWRDSDNTTVLMPPTKSQEIRDGLQDFINEGRRLQQVCKLNNNIVNVNEVFEANGTAYYVLEYLDGGDLRKMVRNNGKPLTEQQMIDVMMPIGRAVQCLHGHHMLHLDIKPDNIVMRRDDGNGKEEPVLIDFGIAVHFGGDGSPTSKTPSLGVSPGYSPIEQYTQVRSFDPRFDVYAFSATCLYLLTGKSPVEAMNMPAGFVRSVMPQQVSERVTSAIERGMSKEKEYRTTSITELLSSFVALGTPPVTPAVESQDVAPTRVINDVVPRPIAPVQEYVEDSNNYSYDNEHEDGGKKKKMLAIIGGLLGIVLLAGLVFWLMNGGLSGKVRKSDTKESESITNDSITNSISESVSASETETVYESSAIPDIYSFPYYSGARIGEEMADLVTDDGFAGTMDGMTLQQQFREWHVSSTSHYRQIKASDNGYDYQFFFDRDSGQLSGVALSHYVYEPWEECGIIDERFGTSDNNRIVTMPNGAKVSPGYTGDKVYIFYYYPCAPDPSPAPRQ